VTRLSAAIAAFILLGAAEARAAEPVQVGMVARLAGEARAEQAGGMRTLSVPDGLFYRDRLRTGADSRLLGRLADDSEVTLGANAELVLDEFIYDPAADSRVVKLRSLAGAFLLAIDDAVSPGGTEVTVTTPAAVIGIRGTTVWGGEIDAGYGVLALDGTVTVTTPAGTQTLAPGEGVTITLPGEPVPVVTWPDDKVQRAVATVTFPE
jgi:hypothetical protein